MPPLCVLAYESQQEPIRMRGLLKAQKILTRLGAKPRQCVKSNRVRDN